MADAPKANSLFEPGTQVTPVLGPTGVAQTATVQRPRAPEPIEPPQPAGGVLPPAQSNEQDLETFFQEEMLRDLQPMLGRTGAGEFVPEDLAGQAQFERGSIGSTFRQGFNQGLLGAALNTDLMTPEKQAQLDGEVLNYTGDHPYWALASGMAGRFTSDLPGEILVSLATGGTGAIAQTVSLTGRYGRNAQKVAESIAKLRQASRSGTLAQRTSLQAGQDAMEGFAAGVLSEGVRFELGRGSSIEQAVQAGVNDALIAPVFGFLMRSGIKLGGKVGRAARNQFVQKVKEQTVKDLAPDVENIKDVEAAVNKELPKLEEKIFRSREDIDAGKKINVNKNFRGTLKDIDANLKKQDEPDLRKTLKAVRASVRRGGGNDAAKMFDEIEVTVADLPAGEAARYIAPDDASSFGRIEISAKAKDPARAFVHEAVHAATVNRIAELPVDRGERVILRSLMVDAREALPDFDGQAFDNEFEFIAEVFSNPDLQNALKSIEASVDLRGEGQSLWDRFLDAVKRILGDTGIKNSVLENAVRTADTVIGSQAKKLERRARPTPPASRLSGQAQLFSTATSKEVPPQVAEKQGEISQLKADILSDDLTVNIQGGDAYPKSDAGRNYAKLKNASPTFSWTNSTLNMLFPQLGGAADRIAQLGYDAANLTGKLIVKMDTAYTNAISKVPQADLVNLKNKSSVRVDTVTLRDDNGLDFDKVDLELNGFERLWITGAAQDGLESLGDIDLPDVKRTQHSAGDSLIYPGEWRVNELGASEKVDPAGVRIGGKNIVLTRAQRDWIAKGNLLSDSEKQMLDAIQGAYRAIVDDVNELSQQLLGRDVMYKKNNFYMPKYTMSGVSDFKDAALSFEQAFDSRPGVGGAIMERTGVGKLRPVNPFDQLNLYMNKTAQAVGHLEYNHNARTFVNTAERDGILSEGIGSALPQTMRKLIKVSMGDASELGRNPDSAMSKVFTFRQLGILFANISATLKQPASAWAAAATGLLNESGGSIFLRVGSYLAQPKKLKTKLAKMESDIPMFAHRQMKSSRMLDVDEVGSGSMHLVMGREIPVEEMLKMMAKREIKFTDGMLDLLERGLFTIRRFDEATMAALHDASLDTVKAQKGNGRTADDIFVQVTMDTQPTRTPTTTSLNQQSGNIFTRAFTQFTTPTRKAAELGDKWVTKYLNLPAVERDMNAKFELLVRMYPLIVGSAYAAGGGFVAMEARGAAVQTVESRNAKRQRRRRERLERRQRDVTKAILGNVLRTAVGQVPVSGSILDTMVASAFDQRTFDPSNPIFGELREIAQGIGDKDLVKLQKNLAQLAGVPGELNRFIQASIK